MVSHKRVGTAMLGHRVRTLPYLAACTSAGSSPVQVECLIDLATDPDVLGRQWIGLATWV